MALQVNSNNPFGTPPVPDFALITAAQQGDSEAIEQLLSSSRGIAYRAAYTSLHNHHDAEDVVQSALLEAYLNLHRLSDPNRFRGWLRRIALNHAADKLRRKSIVRPAQFESADVGSTDAVSANGDRSSAVQLAMNTLNPLLREALELHYLQNCPLKEISVRLGVPIGTVKRRLHAARERLRTIGAAIERKC